jgi:hypothetical protein
VSKETSGRADSLFSKRVRGGGGKNTVMVGPASESQEHRRFGKSGATSIGTRPIMLHTRHTTRSSRDVLVIHLLSLVPPTQHRPALSNHSLHTGLCTPSNGRRVPAMQHGEGEGCCRPLLPDGGCSYIMCQRAPRRTRMQGTRVRPATMCVCVSHLPPLLCSRLFGGGDQIT